MNSNAATQSFDRMRSMLVRAAEIRDSEQQQVFDALDEIHARLAPLESLGSVRKRLSEMPDRTEVSVLAERVDEALSKLESQDSAIAALARAVELIADKLAAPFAELGGRLDGMAGRFEGVAGRMDGLEDRVAGLHKRIDGLDQHLDRQDTRLDGLPAAVDGVVQRLDVLPARLDTLEGGVGGRISSVTEHLDEAMATFAEIIMGGAPASLPPALPPPRPAQRRIRSSRQAQSAQVQSAQAESAQPRYAESEQGIDGQEATAS